MRFASSEVLDLFIDNKRSLKVKNPQKFGACLACQSPKIKYLFQKHFFDHWGCQQCGFIFVNPRPSEDDLVKMYTNLTYFSNRFVFQAEDGIRDGLSFNI